MTQLFANSAAGVLASNITSFATSISVATGNGLTFPAITGSDYYYCTIENLARTSREIVKVTARVSDTFTVVRGQDGSTAYAFNSGDYFELRLVRASLQDLNILNYLTTTLPLNNGTAAIGTSLKYAREDHVHNIDSSKADKAASLAQFTAAGTTSANLASIMSDETGTGSLVFNTSPTLVTPNLGTPASGNLANCTFPTLNQNTTGSSASCTGNAATASSIGTYGVPGSLAWDAVDGYQITAKSGSSYDFSIFNPTNTGRILGVTTGTNDVVFNGLVTAATFVGNLNGNASTATLATTATTATVAQQLGATGTPGSIIYNVTDGLLSYGKAGTFSDFTISNPTGSALVMYVPTGTNNANFPGTVTSSSFIGSLAGNAASATNATNATNATTLIGDRTNWASYRTNAVANMLGWKNYGNAHVIFDASKSLSPDGSSINSNDSQVAWTPTYPTLMGWNGANTYGVRVDSARIADTALLFANMVNRTAQRAMNVTYTNTSGKPMLVNVDVYTNGYVYAGPFDSYLVINGLAVARSYCNNVGGTNVVQINTLSGVVPIGGTYYASGTYGGRWIEWT